MKLNVLALSLLVCMSMLVSCVGNRVGTRTSNYDKFNQSQVNAVYVHDAYPYTIMLTKVNQPEKLNHIAFHVSARESDYKPYHEAVLLIDGVRYELMGKSDLDDVSVGQYSVSYLQSSIFLADPKTIRAMHDASSIEMRMYSREGPSAPVAMTPDGVEAAKSFVAEFGR